MIWSASSILISVMPRRIFSLFYTLALLSACVNELADGYGVQNSIILKAVVESNDTKVGVSVDKQAGKVAYTWTKGDIVAVQTASGDLSDFTLVGEGGSSTADFKGEALPSSDAVAVFPAAVANAMDDENMLTVRLPESYVYTEGQTNALMYARLNGNYMRFNHLASLLSVEIEDVPAGATLVLTAPEKKINGDYPVDCLVNVPVLEIQSTDVSDFSRVSVGFPQAVSLAQVYLPLPVGEYESLVVEVLDKDGNIIEGSQRTTLSKKNFTRACMKSLPRIKMMLPTLELPQRAYNMETVTLSCGNVPDGQKVTIDWGDGTAGSELRGSGVVTHQFVNDTGSDKTMTVTLRTDGQTVTRDIYVYSLTALSEVARRFKDPSCTDVWVMAHRANTSNKSIPENSISAVKASIAAGVQIVETDTRLTADGQIVICHDESISRTTNGSGNISDLTLSKIRSYKLKDRNSRVTSEVMPTLREFLEAARGKIYVNLDYSPRTASTAQVMAVVEELGMYEQVLFYCNSATKVAEVGAINPYAHAYAWFTTHAALKQLPGEHFMQCSYVPDSPTDVSASLANGMICTVNMLNDVPATYVDTEKLQQLFTYYPSTRVIQTDASDKLLEVLHGGVIQSQPRDYFVTPSGSGDKSGDSWENAMDMVQWRAFVGTSAASKTYGDCAEVDKATFHFMEGTYCVADDEYGALRMEYTDYGKECLITILGGYDSSSRGTDLSKRNPQANITELTGDVNGNGVADSGDAGIFYLDGFARLHVDGVTFAHSYGRSRWDQKAFMLNSATSGALVRADFTKCRFHDLYGFKDSENKYHGGAAVWVGKNAQATLNGCELYDCHSYSRGGALRIAESTGIIFLNECAVHDNAITERFGSAVHVTSGSFLANNCTVAHNDGHFGVLNGSGNWLLVNSTIVADYVSSTSGSNMTWRSESGSDRTAAMVNTVMLFDGYTSVLVNGTTYMLASLGYNMTGTNGEYFSPHSLDMTGCTTTSLGLSWNAAGYYQWNGPASGFTCPTLTAIEQAVKTGCNRSAGPYSNIGLEFYNWLQCLQSGRNPLAFDQAGNPRNASAMWPGAYEKH